MATSQLEGCYQNLWMFQKYLPQCKHADTHRCRKTHKHEQVYLVQYTVTWRDRERTVWDSCSLSSKQSVHSPLTSDINEAFFLLFIPFTVHYRDDCVEKYIDTPRLHAINHLFSSLGCSVWSKADHNVFTCLNKIGSWQEIFVLKGR